MVGEFHKHKHAVLRSIFITNYRLCCHHYKHNDRNDASQLASKEFGRSQTLEPVIFPNAVDQVRGNVYIESRTLYCDHEGDSA